MDALVISHLSSSYNWFSSGAVAMNQSWIVYCFCFSLLLGKPWDSSTWKNTTWEKILELFPSIFSSKSRTFITPTLWKLRCLTCSYNSGALELSIYIWTKNHKMNGFWTFRHISWSKEELVRHSGTPRNPLGTLEMNPSREMLLPLEFLHQLMVDIPRKQKWGWFSTQ